MKEIDRDKLKEKLLAQVLVDGTSKHRMIEAKLNLTVLVCTAMKETAIIFLLAIALWSCGTSDDDVAGPCVHTFEGPVMHIDSVTDARSGRAIAALKIYDVARDGIRQYPALLKNGSNNVVVYDSALVCNIPCGFGTSAGVYTLRVSATGYRDTTIVVNARYAVFNGGCPSSNSGGGNKGPVPHAAAVVCAGAAWANDPLRENGRDHEAREMDEEDERVFIRNCSGSFVCFEIEFSSRRLPRA